MKPDIVNALVKAIAPTESDNPSVIGERVNLTKTLRQKSGPSINGAELARLVDMRLRQGSKSGTKITPEKMVEEIESTLDLVEMCDVLLEARQRRWKESAHEIATAIHSPRSDEEQRLVERIEAEKYPLDFTIGLIRMGVPGDSAAKREAAYWKFFKHAYSMDRFIESGGSFGLGWENFKQLPEDELRAAFEKEKARPWPSADNLWFVAQNWRHWFEREKHDGQVRKGLASAKARAQRRAAEEK